MEQDEVRDEALAKIAEKWRDAAALGCVDALECTLREAWQASREAVGIQWPDRFDYSDPDCAGAALLDCRAAIHAAGIRTR